MLCLLGKPLIILYHAIVGSGRNFLMTRFLFKSLFVLQKKANQPDVFSQIKRRTQFKQKRCSWIFHKSNQAKSKRAQDLIDDQLDVVNFLRNMFLVNASMRVLFTKLERFLLKNQSHPFVLNSQEKVCSSDESGQNYNARAIE